MKMRVKMDTIVLPEDVPGDVCAAVAMALHAELGSTHRAITSAMRWTGASERTVKYWFAGERGPSGENLVSPVRHSEVVLVLLLTMADRLVFEERQG